MEENLEEFLRFQVFIFLQFNYLKKEAKTHQLNNYWIGFNLNLHYYLNLKIHMVNIMAMYFINNSLSEFILI